MNLKKIGKLFLVALLSVMFCLTIVGCQKPDTPSVETPPVQESGKATYTIRVVDYQGNVPAVDVLVEVKNQPHRQLRYWRPQWRYRSYRP